MKQARIKSITPKVHQTVIYVDGPAPAAGGESGPLSLDSSLTCATYSLVTLSTILNFSASQFPVLHLEIKPEPTQTYLEFINFLQVKQF